jgi:hypothetical protein
MQEIPIRQNAFLYCVLSEGIYPDSDATLLGGWGGRRLAVVAANILPARTILTSPGGPKGRMFVRVGVWVWKRCVVVCVEGVGAGAEFSRVAGPYIKQFLLGVASLWLAIKVTARAALFLLSNSCFFNSMHYVCHTECRLVWLRGRLCLAEAEAGPGRAGAGAGEVCRKENSSVTSALSSGVCCCHSIAHCSLPLLLPLLL